MHSLLPPVLTDHLVLSAAFAVALTFALRAFVREVFDALTERPAPPQPAKARTPWAISDEAARELEHTAIH